MEALSKQDNEINLNDDFDFWAVVSRLKEPYFKFCRAYQARVRVVLADYRMICELEEQATTAKVKGVIQQCATRKVMNKHCSFIRVVLAAP
jgi:hypothetical protein